MSSAMPVLILGAGEFAQDVRERLKECGPYDLRGYIRTIEAEPGNDSLDGLPVYGLGDLENIPREFRIVNAIGSVRRRSPISRLREQGFELETIVHPTVIRDATVEFGPGCYCLTGGNFSSYVRMGISVTTTCNVNLGHHVRIGDFSTLAQGAGVGGGSVIGNDVYVGMAAVILDHLKVGDGAIVGAGAVVTRDVPPRTKVMGVPARVVAENVAPL